MSWPCGCARKHAGPEAGAARSLGPKAAQYSAAALGRRRGLLRIRAQAHFCHGLGCDPCPTYPPNIILALLLHGTHGVSDLSLEPSQVLVVT